MKIIARMALGVVGLGACGGAPLRRDEAPPRVATTREASAANLAARDDALRITVTRDAVKLGNLVVEDVRGQTRARPLGTLLEKLHERRSGDQEVWIDVSADCSPSVLASVVLTAEYARLARQNIRAGGSWVRAWLPFTIAERGEVRPNRTRIELVPGPESVRVTWQSGRPCASVPADAEVPTSDLSGYLDRSCEGQADCLQQANISAQAAASAADIVAAIDAAERHGDPHTLAVRMLASTEGRHECGESLNDDFARIEPSEVQRVVRASFGLMRECYQRALARYPALAGRVAVKFVIGRDGSVVTAALDDGSDLPDREATSCIVQVFQKLVFPQPDGGQVTVVYPIQFNPAP